MNRPNLEDYKRLEKVKEGWQSNIKFVKYRLDLEKYCDELEERFKRQIQEANLKIEYYKKENKQLKKDYEVQKQYFADVLHETKEDLEKARDTLIKERNLITRLYKQLESLKDDRTNRERV